MELNLMGTQVNVVLKGEAGRGVLLLHGWGCSAEMMSGIQNALSGSMRTLALDFPGHGAMGHAAPPPETWGVPEYAELCVQLIRKYDLAPCDLIAHSFGGRVAIWLAANHPELVGRMVLTGAAGVPKPASGQLQARQKLYKRLRKAVDLADSLRILGDRPAQWKEALIQKYGSPDYRALTSEMRQVFNKVIGLDLTPYLPKVKASTLLYWGAKDTETPLWMGKVMEEKIPDAGLVVEEGASHFAFVEHADVFRTIVRQFLLEGRDA